MNCSPLSRSEYDRRDNLSIIGSLLGPYLYHTTTRSNLLGPLVSNIQHNTIKIVHLSFNESRIFSFLHYSAYCTSYSSNVYSAELLNDTQNGF